MGLRIHTQTQNTAVTTWEGLCPPAAGACGCAPYAARAARRPMNDEEIGYIRGSCHRARWGRRDQERG